MGQWSYPLNPMTFSNANILTITKGDWRWKCSILSPPTSVSDPNKPESSHWILRQVRGWIQVRDQEYSLFFIFSQRCVSCSRAASRVPSAVPVKKPITRSPFSTISSCPVHYWPDHCTGVYPELSPVSCVRTKCGPHIWQLQISHHLAPSLSSHIAFIQSKSVTRTQLSKWHQKLPL